MADHIYTMLHMYCGIGGAALGEREASARFQEHDARFTSIGGVDFDAQACRDFTRLTGAPALCADVHTLQPAELRRFSGDRRPDAVMSSPPCKGFSRLLSSKKAKEPKYVEMNQLLLKGLFLLCSTWDEPPPLMFFENVPGILDRGREMVEDALQLLAAHNYAVDIGTHNCGEIGNLAQNRPRWFMLARQRARLPHHVYQPQKHPVRACGEVIGPMPMPGDVDRGGPMHTVPRLSWENWKRLARIPAGGDWRDLGGVVPRGKKKREVHRRHQVQAFDQPTPAITGPGGHAVSAVADPRAPQMCFDNRMPLIGWDDPAKSVIGALQVGSGALSVADDRPRDWFSNVLRVSAWDEAAGTVTGAARPSGGAVSIADPRFGHTERVTPWDEPTGVITRSPAPSSGGAAVADPRRGGGRLGVTDWTEPTGVVAGESLPNNGRYSVADPRFAEGKKKNWQQVAGVTPWDAAGPTVSGTAKIHTGAFQVADPRPFNKPPRATAYKVMRWDEAANTITAVLKVDNGAAAIADPRVDIGPATPDEIAAAEAATAADPKWAPKYVPLIIAPDGTWHRPLTTLELAALQGFPTVVDGEPLVLDGKSHTRWRMAIGNAVPPPAARAVCDQLLQALLLSELGAFALSSDPIWVAPEPRTAA